MAYRLTGGVPVEAEADGWTAWQADTSEPVGAHPVDPSSLASQDPDVGPGAVVQAGVAGRPVTGRRMVAVAGHLAVRSGSPGEGGSDLAVRSDSRSEVVGDLALRHDSPGEGAGDLALWHEAPGEVAGAEQLADRVAVLHQSLRSQPDLAPSSTVDRLFGELVELCGRHGGDLSPRAARVLEDERVASCLTDLHEVCAEGEYLLELYWSRRIAAAGDARAELAGFPYLENYRELTRLEINLLRCFGVEPEKARRICFLGAGPLPLRAVCLYDELAVPVDVVDHDPEAVALGSACVEALLGPGAVRFHRAEAAEFEPVAEAGIVVLGALAGLGGEAKNAILQALWHRLKPGTVILVRSAAGLRRLLYPAVGAQDLGGWEQLGVLHPLNGVINSVIVLRRP